MDIGLVRKVDIDNEMQQSYLDYAMSVIVARALPDARDGLKPVQRRILFSMYDMGLRSNTDYKKSARIVGEVLGKYHPHGDTAVYEAMARLAQDFSMRHMLVDGQGNFGSVDGDPPAAMRYTEARLSAVSMELLNQIDRDTVDFTPNFDGTLQEPDVLPAALPNLLVNGSNGIAVGMATNIPPHNLGEIVDALVYMLRHWDGLDDIPVTDLMNFVKGPDFPTGGIILQQGDQNEILMAYATGRGKITIRGRVHIEEMSRGRNRLIISELPYMTNKSSLIEKIAELVREGDIEGIADLRDESDRHGMRIVIELKQGADADKILLALYKHTPLQNTFGIILLALVNDEPHMLTLKQALKVYLDHRLVVIQRRTAFDLAKAKARAHILEGYQIALRNLDEIIALIKAAPDVESAREKLMKRFKLSEIQAQAILDMQLRRLAGLERKKIELEYKEVTGFIKELESLLNSPKSIRDLVEQELLLVKQTFADRRRTQIASLKEGESIKDLLTSAAVTPVQEIWVGVSAEGRIGRTQGDVMPHITGREPARFVLRTSSHQTLYLVGESGRAAAINPEVLPVVEQFNGGASFSKISPLGEDETMAALFSIPAASEIDGDRFIISVTRGGMVKKSAVSDLPGPSAQELTLVKTNPGDAVIWLGISDGTQELLLATAQGMAIRFSEADVRSMGLVAAGVNGMKLTPGDAIIGAALVQPEADLFLVAANGKAWRIPLAEFPLQGRYGSGVVVCKLEKNNRLVACMQGKESSSGILLFDRATALNIHLSVVKSGKRLRLGLELVQLKAGDTVTGLLVPLDMQSYWIGTTLGGGSKKRTRAAKPKGETSVSQLSLDLKAANPTHVSSNTAESGKTTGKLSSTSSNAKPPEKSAKPSTAKRETAGATKPPNAKVSSKKSGAKRANSKATSRPPKGTQSKLSTGSVKPEKLHSSKTIQGRGSEGITSQKTGMTKKPATPKPKKSK